MKNVTIYSTPTCSYCKAAKEFFAENNVQFTEHDVAGDQAKREEMLKKSGQLGVPVITIDDAVVVGFDQPKLQELLEIA